MKRLGWLATGVTLGLMIIVMLFGVVVEKAIAGDEVSEAEAIANVANEHTPYIAIAIALVMAAACLGAGYAVGKVGSAALGAASENPELIGRSLIFVGLAEGIAIYGLIVAIMLLRYMII